MMKKSEPSLPVTLKAPSTKTLKRYGLSKLDWICIAAAQDSVCGICKKLPPSGKLNIDHEHVRGWSKMPPDKRKLYVRGLLDWRCNYHFAGKGMTLDKAKNLVNYLEAYARVSG